MNSKLSANVKPLISFPQILDTFFIPSSHGKVKQALGMQLQVDQRQAEAGKVILYCVHSQAKHKPSLGSPCSPPQQCAVQCWEDTIAHLDIPLFLPCIFTLGNDFVRYYFYKVLLVSILSLCEIIMFLGKRTISYIFL